MIEDAGFIFLTEDIEDFFLLGDAGHGLVDDLEGVEGSGSGVELPDSTVDKNEAGQQLLFFLEAAVAPGDHFKHAGEVVVLAKSLREAAGFSTANNKFAVVGFFHSA